MNARFWAGLRHLTDLRITLPTSLASIYLGVAVSASDGPISAFWLAVTVLAFFAVEVAKEAWGDIFDYDTGDDLAVAPTDRTRFSGGDRVLVDHLLSHRQASGIAVVFALAGLALGATIVLWREPSALWIGILGFGLAWSYNGPPLRLSYRGFGELDVAVCYGPLIALSTYLIQAHRLSWEVFWLSLPLGITIAAFLWVNEFPDFDADRTTSKRNLVVRLGRGTAARVLPLPYLAALAILVTLPSVGLPRTVWLAALFVPPATYACFHAWRAPDTFYRSKPVQPAALLAFLLYSLGAGTGVLLG